MADDEVAEAEARFGLVFPPDYRLFLQTLHTTDPERVRFEDGKIRERVGRPFHDWTGHRDLIDKAMAWPVEGLLWSIEADHSWTSRWGERPLSREGRAELITRLSTEGAPLIPLMGHRYLVGSPLASGNPVLSIYGSDVIVYSPTFGDWLVEELASMIHPALKVLAPDARASHFAVPFWQDVIDDDGWVA
jgi:hypothetical protein